ncbi:hypothetical protein V1264_000395 [Littorina saxatilis]
MTDLAAGTLAAKIDVYPDEASSRQGQGQGRASDRMTFILDRVTAVQLASSKTHPFAFEIMETNPVLVLSGSSELESFSWMSALRNLFFADENAKDTESFKVTIQQSADSQRLVLKGSYVLRVSPNGVEVVAHPKDHGKPSQARQNSLERTSTLTPNSGKLTSASPKTLGKLSPANSNTNGRPSTPSSPTEEFAYGQRRHDSVRSDGSETDGSEGKGRTGEEVKEAEDEEEKVLIVWKLSMLKRFNVEKETSSGQSRVFMLECGPNSPIGEATFRFVSKDASNILASIRRCISVAMATRQRMPRTTSDPRTRTESVLTVSGYQALLDRSPRVDETLSENELEDPSKVIPRSVRSGSGSSVSTVTPISPTSSAGGVEMRGFGDDLSADCDENYAAVPRRHRTSVVSFCGSLSSSPGKSSDIFGSDFQHHQELQMQQWQMQQQVMMLQQQQQQQQQPGQFQSQSPLPVAHQYHHQQQQQLAQWNQQQTYPMDQSQQQMYQFQQWNGQNISPTQQQQHMLFWTQQQQQYVQQQQSQQLQQQHLQNLMKERGAGMVRNSSVPNVVSLDTDDKTPHMIEQTELVRLRASSMTTERPRASESVCSGDSGVVVTDRTSTRLGSNSFDSQVSTESSVSNRKTSDGPEPIFESSPKDISHSCGNAHSLDFMPHPQSVPAALAEQKTTPDGSSSNIYQDLDTLGNSDGFRISREQLMTRRRSQSMSDVRKENDYEEVGGARRGVVPAVSVLAVTQLDTPPELPARPASFLQGKSKTTKGRLKSGFGFLTGNRLSSIKDGKERLSCEEIHAHASASPKGTLSRSGSTDLYSTIGDTSILDQDGKSSLRRRSSDITPVSSHPDLRIPERPSTPKAKPVPAPRNSSLRSSPSPAAFLLDIGEEDGSGSKAPSESLSLLTFSDHDLWEIGGDKLKAASTSTSVGGVRPDSVPESKAALLDFFLNDATFHNNPMVTGDLPVPVLQTNQDFTGRSQEMQSPHTFSIAPHGNTGWENCSNPGQFPNFSTSGNPWAGATSMGQPGGPMNMRPASSPAPFTQTTPNWSGGSGGGGTGITAKVEGVYIDMRKNPEGGDDGGGDYVAPGELNKNQAFLDFLLFQ